MLAYLINPFQNIKIDHYDVKVSSKLRFATQTAPKSRSIPKTLVSIHHQLIHRRHTITKSLSHVANVATKSHTITSNQIFIISIAVAHSVSIHISFGSHHAAHIVAPSSRCHGRFREYFRNISISLLQSPEAARVDNSSACGSRTFSDNFHDSSTRHREPPECDTAPL